MKTLLVCSHRHTPFLATIQHLYVELDLARYGKLRIGPWDEAAVWTVLENSDTCAIQAGLEDSDTLAVAPETQSFALGRPSASYQA
jgi:hypothetical protein